MAQVINQSWTEAENLVIGPEGGRNMHHVLKAISSRTGHRWLSKIGYMRKGVRQGVYRDCHEREDVIAYAKEAFLPTLKSLTSQLMAWDMKLVPQLTIQALNEVVQAHQ